MNTGKMLGGMLVILGIVLGVTTFSITGAAIGYLNLPGLLGIIAGVSFLIGIVIFLSSMEKDEKVEDTEQIAVRVFSEKDED